MRTPRTITGLVTGTRRHGHTVYGNPMMSVQIDGEWFRISNDSGLVYAIDNPEYHDHAHTFVLTRNGRIMFGQDPRATACSILAGSCSDDRVTTFYGASRPVVLCGRHAAGMSPANWSTLHKAGRAAMRPE